MAKLFVVVLVACLAMAIADEFNEYEEKAPKETASNDEPKMVMEDMNSETSTALDVQNEDDAIKNKGFCHWNINVWYKPGRGIRCNCMKCTCQNGGNWACGYEFAFCPYFYCGNVIYNPNTQVCCCGKAHNKRKHFHCCGYFHYDNRANQCCNYYSVKPNKATCPRHRV